MRPVPSVEPPTSRTGPRRAALLAAALGLSSLAFAVAAPAAIAGGLRDGSVGDHLHVRFHGYGRDVHGSGRCHGAPRGGDGSPGWSGPADRPVGGRPGWSANSTWPRATW